MTIIHHIINPFKQMKYLQTYNESLRDKMTPKSEDEIRNKIKSLMGVNDDIISIKLWNPSGFKLVSRDSGIDEENYRMDYHKLTGDIVKIYDYLVDYLSKFPGEKLNNLDRFLIKESLRDKMTPKSDKEVDDKLDELYEYLIKMCIKEGVFKNVIEAEEHIEDVWDDIVQMVFEEGLTKEDVYNAYWGVNESLRDKMIPISKEKLKQLTKSLLGLPGDKIGIKIRKPSSPLNLDTIIKHSEDANVEYTINENDIIIFGNFENMYIFVTEYFGLKDTKEIKSLIHRIIDSIE